MKKTTVAFLGLFLLLSLSSCYWRPNADSGGLRVDVSGIASRLGDAGAVIRVYLIADGLLFSAGGGVPYVAEIPATGNWDEEQVIRISGLPTTPKYKVMVGLGYPGEGTYSWNLYGESGQFLVTPGGDTAVSVRLQYLQSPDTPSFELIGSNLKGLVNASSGVFAAEEQVLHYLYYDGSWSYFSSYELPLDTNDQGVTAYRINGLSRGGLFFDYYLDSDNGILPFTESDTYYFFEKTFSEGLGGSRGIRESGIFNGYSEEYGYGNAVFFRRDGGLGGTFVPSEYGEPSTWKWANVDLDGVQDLAVGYANAFFVADGSAFALPPAFLTDPTPSLSGRRINLPSPAPVNCLGVVSGEGTTLYLGTTNGAWTMGVSESESEPFVEYWADSLYPVDGTAGDNIERIAITTYGEREAYLSRYYLYIKTYYNFYKIPFFAIVPGRATDMVWDDNGYTLYISGTEGLAALYIGSGY